METEDNVSGHEKNSDRLMAVKVKGRECDNSSRQTMSWAYRAEERSFSK